MDQNEAPCTELITEAIDTLNEALSTCANSLTCDCHGKVVSCLSDTTISLFRRPETGSATVQVDICSQCMPDNSSVSLTFINEEGANTTIFYSSTITNICCNSSSFMSVSGTGIVIIDGFPLPLDDFSFGFGKIAEQCFISLKVGSQNDPFFIVEDFVPCSDTISITPCLEERVMSSSCVTSMNSPRRPSVNSPSFPIQNEGQISAQSCSINAGFITDSTLCAIGRNECNYCSSSVNIDISCDGTGSVLLCIAELNPPKNTLNFCSTTITSVTCVSPSEVTVEATGILYIGGKGCCTISGGDCSCDLSGRKHKYDATCTFNICCGDSTSCGGSTPESVQVSFKLFINDFFITNYVTIPGFPVCPIASCSS